MTRSLGLFLLGMLTVLMAVEALMQCLPVSSATKTGYHIDPRILTYPPQHRWTVSTGWDLRNSRRLTANNLGFVADQDFVPGPQALGLIGDSYVEAGMLEPAERPAAQLAALISGGRPVYALGGPGSALLDYAERIRFASDRLGVKDFVVVMEPGDIRQALCGSGNVHGPCLDRDSLVARDELHAGPSLAKRLLRHSALAQYAVGQLKIDGARLLGQAFLGAFGAPSDKNAVRPAASDANLASVQSRRVQMVETVARHFFERIAPYATGNLVLVIDGRRTTAALKDNSAALTPLMQERAAFIGLARARGVTVIDAEALYQQHWTKSDLALEVGPYDGHLNKIGVGLLMRAVAGALK